VSHRCPGGTRTPRARLAWTATALMVGVATAAAQDTLAGRHVRARMIDSATLARIIAFDSAAPKPYAGVLLYANPHKGELAQWYLSASSTRLAAVLPVATALGLEAWTPSEADDEQRFVIAPDTYGPFTQVFASPYLAGFTHYKQFDGHGNRGALVAIVFVDTTDGVTVGYPQYDLLNLKGGTNCVWLGHQHGHAEQDGWFAYIGQADNCEFDPSKSRSMMAVTAMPFSGRPADIPASARFHEDEREATYFIGLRCLDRWCIIGGVPSPMAKRPVHRGDPPPPLSKRAWVMIGAHDEQKLAIVRGMGPQPHPSRIRASVTPVDDLDQLDESDYATWRDVATFWLRDDPEGTKYAPDCPTKPRGCWGLRRGKNTLQLRYDGVWHAQVLPGGNGTPWPLDVNDCAHFDVMVPGTARFHWRDDDDTVWIRCSQGCCQVQPG
jgi:hypothetical protein